VICPAVATAEAAQHAPRADAGGERPGFPLVRCRLDAAAGGA